MTCARKLPAPNFANKYNYVRFRVSEIGNMPFTDVGITQVSDYGDIHCYQPSFHYLSYPAQSVRQSLALPEGRRRTALRAVRASRMFAVSLI